MKKKATVEDRLIGNGNIFAAAIRDNKKISGTDQKIIDRARTDAIRAGYGWTGINGLEMEGERGVRGSMAMPIEINFNHDMPTGIFNMTCRQYDVVGDHKLNHSTVDVLDLIHNKLVPYDIFFLTIIYEYLKCHLVIMKSQTVIAYYYFLGYKQRVEAKFEKLKKKVRF